MNENKQAEPVAADHSGLIKRIDAAIERVTQGRGLMSIPADPRSDVDLVLSECKALFEGKNPPFWATDFHPAQPVQPAVAQEPVGYQFRTRPAHHREKGWGSWEPCDKRLFDACIKIPVNNDLEFEVRRIYSEAPAAAINEQLYTALEGLLAITRDSQGVAGYHLNGVIAKWDEFEEVSAADAALKSAKEHVL